VLEERRPKTHTHHVGATLAHAVDSLQLDVVGLAARRCGEGTQVGELRKGTRCSAELNKHKHTAGTTSVVNRHNTHRQ
jgi:hypothetical protein